MDVCVCHGCMMSAWNERRAGPRAHPRSRALVGRARWVVRGGIVGVGTDDRGGTDRPANSVVYAHARVCRTYRAFSHDP